MAKRLEGKKIFVTGGSRGIGAAIAMQAAAEGASVAVSYASREDAAKEVVNQLPGSGHLCVRMDLANEESIQQACNEVLGGFSGLDGLVNNAGMTKDQLLLRMKTDDFDQVIQANLRGTFLCSKAILKPMMKARQGSIVHLTSVVGLTGNAGQANYSASKGGIESFSKSLALELATRGIRSNCVAPGFIATDMTGQLNEDQKQGILTRIPLGKMGAPEDVALGVCFLLSDESKYITGHTLNVNGGMYM